MGERKKEKEKKVFLSAITTREIRSLASRGKRGSGAKKRAKKRGRSERSATEPTTLLISRFRPRIRERAVLYLACYI